MKAQIWLVAATLTLALACGDDGSGTPDAGGSMDGARCFGNGTCNAGLSCVDDVCRVADGSGAQQVDAGTDGGPGDPRASPLDPDTFSGMHQTELADDCDKTVQCKAQRGETLRKDDPIGHCILDTANALNDDKKLQDSFLSNYSRCRSFPVCVYVDCASTGGGTYGDTQRSDVQHACQAEIECNQVRGGMGNNDPVVCEETKVNELNRYVPTQRSRWEASFEACKADLGCNFVDCYDAAFFGT